MGGKLMPIPAKIDSQLSGEQATPGQLAQTRYVERCGFVEERTAHGFRAAEDAADKAREERRAARREDENAWEFVD